jgi:hypothetical protein
LRTDVILVCELYGFMCASDFTAAQDKQVTE